VTIQDGDTVARVLGARVEPFLQAPPQQTPETLDKLAVDLTSKGQPNLSDDLKAVQHGKMSYLDFQKKRVEASEKLKQLQH
jgi:hypothetical protein